MDNEILQQILKGQELMFSEIKEMKTEVAEIKKKVDIIEEKVDILYLLSDAAFKDILMLDDRIDKLKRA